MQRDNIKDNKIQVHVVRGVTMGKTWAQILIDEIKYLGAICKPDSLPVPPTTKPYPRLHPPFKIICDFEHLY